MKRFLFSATTRDGRKFHDRVESANLGHARHTLEALGHRDIEFLSDENVEDISRAARIGVGVPVEKPEWWTVGDEIQSRRRRGLMQKLRWAFGRHLEFAWPLVLWNVISCVHGRPFREMDWLGFIVTLLYGVWFARKILPMTLFQLILEASAWHNWPRLRRLIRFTRLLKRFITTAIPDRELDIREAVSLAAEGRLADGLQLVEKYRKHPDMAEYIFLTRLSGLYDAAGQYDRVVALREEAALKGPGGVSEWIDLAMARIRRKRDVVGAREALKKIEGKEMPAIAQAFRLMVDGMIASEERADVKACEYYRSGLDKLQATGYSPVVFGLIAEARVGMAMSLTRLGEKDVARRILAQERPLLEARGEKDLLARCDSVIGG